MKDIIYLDYNATCPVAPEVQEVVSAALRDAWGNPSSSHAYGLAAREAVERARAHVASLLQCDAGEVVFTSGGTESDNAAVVGVAEARAERGRHLVISEIEHAAVEQSCRYLESRGWEVMRVPVDANGVVRLDDLERALRDDTTLISIMHANNETGVFQPIAEIGKVARSRGITFHTDTAQTVGKVPVRVDELQADLAVVAGHKLYGPKGVGALYLRDGTPFAGFLRGAGHERGRRSGTENVALIAGLGEACRLALLELDRRREHMQKMRDRLEARLREHHASLIVHGGSVERLPNTLYCALLGVDANALLARLEDVAAAGGAACHSGSTRPSSVLLAMGVSPEVARCTLRLCVGRDTTAQEIDEAARRVMAAAVSRPTG